MAKTLYPIINRFNPDDVNILFINSNAVINYTRDLSILNWRIPDVTVIASGDALTTEDGIEITTEGGDTLTTE